MTDTQASALETLRDIDGQLHRLFEAVDSTDETATTPSADPLVALRRVRSQIDAELFEHQRQADSRTLPDDGSCTLQWDPPRTPPRRLVFDPDSDCDTWTRREFEWTGDGWRTCSRSSVRDVAISAPAEPRYPNPLDPPTVETQLDWIRGTWTHPDPAVLVFDATTTTTRSVIVAIDGELRYREVDSDYWATVSDEAALSHHLQKQGQPTVQALSEIPLTRQHFTPSPLTR